jgi:ABC-type transport system involved in multi-copper enzyme maturation permease subunit
MKISLEALLLVYSVAGIAGSWLIFRRVQDAPWSGGVINLPAWLTVPQWRPSRLMEHRRMPLPSLLWKEFHFNLVALAGMAGLFLLQLGAVGIRYFNQNPTEAFWREMNDIMTAVGFLWVIVPLVVGCGSIAEERKLGVLEGQLCQPVSSRCQFLVKGVFTLVVGGLLSSGLCLAAEGVGLLIGVNHGPVEYSFVVLVFGGLSVITLLGLFASSLSKNLLQALPVALGVFAGFGMTISGLVHFSGFSANSSPAHFVLWQPLLPIILLALILTVTLPWLTYRNFRCLHEPRRLWRRNGLVLGAAVLFAMAASLFLYHRAWEIFTPFEPTHGPAHWNLNQRPVALRTDIDNNLLISLPDGRYWFGCLADRQPEWKTKWNWLAYLVAPPPRLAVHQFIEGSGWVSLAAGCVDKVMDPGWHPQSSAKYIHVEECRDTVGIREDGTLWVSENPGQSAWNANAPVQFGGEGGWREVIGECSLWSVLLLKKDGTLWRWGDPFFHPSKAHPVWPGLRAYAPSQIGTNSDWQALVQGAWPVAQKSDGSIWNLWVDFNTHKDGLALNTNLNQAGFTAQHLDCGKLAGDMRGVAAGIRQDGTLWFWGYLHWDWSHLKVQNETLQSGRDTNWVAVALDTWTMVALKSDGTLWQWRAGFNVGQYAEAYTKPPMRLGLHHDWVALTQTRDGIVSLAADGSLWLWRDNAYHDVRHRLIPPSAKPVLLGNILGGSDE